MRRPRSKRCVGCGRRLPNEPIIITTDRGEEFPYCTYECFADSYEEVDDIDESSDAVTGAGDR